MTTNALQYVTWKNIEKGSDIAICFFTLKNAIKEIRERTHTITFRESAILGLKTFKILVDVTSIIAACNETAQQHFFENKTAQFEVREALFYMDLVCLSVTPDQEQKVLTEVLDRKRSLITTICQKYRACFGTLAHLEAAGLLADLGIFYLESQKTPSQNIKMALKSWSRATRIVDATSKNSSDEALNPHTILSKISYISLRLNIITNCAVGLKNFARENRWCTIV